MKVLTLVIVNLVAMKSFTQVEVDKKCKAIYSNLLEKDSLLKQSQASNDSLQTAKNQLQLEFIKLQVKLDEIEREAELIKVGNQKWDKSNLMVKTLNDGTPIFYADTRQKWDSLFLIQKPAYCLHKNDSLGLFGYIYNYYAVSSGKLAPEGMRIPSKEDCNELIRFNQLINGKGAILLKSNDSISSHIPVWKKRGLDIFQMGIRPLGFRLDDSKEWYFGNKIYYWCQITDLKKINLMAITEINDDPFILEKTIEENNSNYGLYVRCIK
jgi:uncharacterized protein (TIGR02145 family)